MNPKLSTPEENVNLYSPRENMDSPDKHLNLHSTKHTRSTLRVGMITCWYRNISMENYSRNLKTMLEKNSGINVAIISSHCICRNKFPENDETGLGKCELVSFPYIYRVGGLNILSSLVQSFLLLLKGINYLEKCRDCDIIHYQQSNFFSFGLMPLLAILLVPTSQKVVVTLHNFDRLQRKFRFLNRAYKNAHRIVVHSSNMKREAEKLGIPGKKIIVLPHGAVVVPLKRSPRREITFFGAPEKRKGFFIILRALKLLKDRRHPLTVNIYGIYSGEEKERAREKARGIGVDEYLIWGGRLEEDEFDQKLQESLFTIAPYLASVSGSSIVTRAMANGTPIISTTVGGILEYLDDVGLLVPPNNPRLLADAMESLFNNSELREKFGKKARERTIEILSWDRVSKEVLRIYMNIASKQ